MKSTSMGDITAVKTGIILQQANAQGRMGSGVAGAIRRKWPAVFDDYAAHVGPEYTQKDSGAGFMGHVIWTQVDTDLFVASIIGQQFIGKEEGRRYTSYDALDTGLRTIVETIKDIGFDDEIHYPLIGCGLGGGEWSIVSSIIDHHLDKINHRLWLTPGMMATWQPC